MTQTTAFVLSGGGNFGALQAGALRALLERNVAAHLVVGTSAGAINAAYFAARPTPQGVSDLEQVWRSVTKDDIYPGSHLSIVWRVITGRESLYPNRHFYQFVKAHMPPNVTCFRDIHHPRLFITAAHLDCGELHLYGADRDESILEAIMASTALPPFSPPWRGADGRLHVDGGAISNLPLGVAMNNGARTIYALHILDVPMRADGLRERVRERARSMAEIGHAAMRAMLKSSLETDLLLVRAQRSVTLHYIPLLGIPDLTFFDFSHSDELVALGYAQTLAYLDAQAQTAAQSAAWRQRVKQWSDKLARAWKVKRYVTLSE